MRLRQIVECLVHCNALVCDGITWFMTIFGLRKINGNEGDLVRL